MISIKFELKSPSRLHFTLIDLNGESGRIDGGIGLTLRDPGFRVKFSDESPMDNPLQIIGPAEYAPLIENLKEKIEREFSLSLPSLTIEIKESIPAHRGLGSKTQLLLTIARGLLEFIREDIGNRIDLEDLDALALGKTTNLEPLLALTKLVGRGGTSGIGYMSFGQGKFIMDLGHSFGEGKDKQSFLPSSASAAPPALLFIQIPFPEEWAIVLIDLNVSQGANAKEEVNIFQEYCPLPLSEVQIVSHRILYGIIPSIIQHDIAPLTKALHTISQHGFKKIEISLQHPYVAYLINYIYETYYLPAGMSSFGPTIFVICPDKETSARIMEELRQKITHDPDSPGGRVFETFAQNHGYEIIR